jgi:hypothetical protein
MAVDRVLQNNFSAPCEKSATKIKNNCNLNHQDTKGTKGTKKSKTKDWIYNSLLKTFLLFAVLGALGVLVVHGFSRRVWGGPPVFMDRIHAVG